MTKPKRRLFDEIREGFEALEAERQGKITLRRYSVEAPEAKHPVEVAVLRERLNMSRPVFAKLLHINPRTLESWEQGRSKPNAQAEVLLRLVERRPDILQELQAI